MGIWTDIIPKSAAYTKYGFNMMFVSSPNEISQAYAAGFKYDSIMLGISHYSVAYNWITTSVDLGYYFIDEPFEDNTYNTNTLYNVAEIIHNNTANGKLLMSSYKWPSE